MGALEGGREGGKEGRRERELALKEEGGREGGMSKCVVVVLGLVVACCQIDKAS